jgi:diguanylate cyclase (GGDEF)-like protein/PAS domain S-box-containing protein
MDRIKRPAPQLLYRVTAVVTASLVWLMLVRLSGGNVVDPTSSAIFAPAALAVVLGITIGWDALAVPLAATVADVILRRHQLDSSTATLELILAAANAGAYVSAGVWLHRRKVDLRDAGMTDLLGLVGPAAIAAPCATALIHTLAVRSLHLDSDPFASTLFAWASRDSVAIIVAASFPFALHQMLKDGRPLRRLAVLRHPGLDRMLACVQIAFLVASVTAAYTLGESDNFPLFLAVPALFWLAASRGYRFAAFGVMLFSAGLIFSDIGTDHVAGMTSLRLQVMSTALLTLAIGAQVDDRRSAGTTYSRMSRELQMSEARYRSVIEHAADGFLVTNQDGEIEIANAAIERLFGIARTDVESANIIDLIPPADDTTALNALAHLLDGGPSSGTSGERYWIGRRADGSTFPLRVALSRIDIEGRVGYAATVQDESDRKQFEELLEHQATHDPLTDLPNRALFHDRLIHEIERLRRQPGSLALLLVDLDRFKQINDTYGHAMGDKVLRETAARLREVMRSGTVARLGGDEFAIVLGPAVDRHAAVAVAQRVLECLRKPINGLPPELTPTASIGIRLISQPGEQPQELLRHADAALYQAKRDGRDCYRFFAHSERPPTPTEIDLRDRITDCSVTLRYQPVIEVVAGHVANIEALARIRKPDGQMMTPSEFIADSARAGLVDRLGELVLRRALTDLCDLRNRVSDELTMSVNVSPRQLANTRFAAMVSDALGMNGLGPDALILEITDSAGLEQVSRRGRDDQQHRGEWRSHSDRRLWQRPHALRHLARSADRRAQDPSRVHQSHGRIRSRRRHRRDHHHAGRTPWHRRGRPRCRNHRARGPAHLDGVYASAGVPLRRTVTHRRTHHGVATVARRPCNCDTSRPLAVTRLSPPQSAPARR